MLSVIKRCLIVTLLWGGVIGCTTAIADNSLQPSYKVTGVDGEALSNAMTMLQNANLDISNTQKIRLALKPFGYFHVTISSHKLIDPKTHKLILVYQVNPGPRVAIINVNIQVSGEGKDNPALNKFIAKFPIKVNQPFDTVKYNAAKDRLFTIATNQGYLNARFENQLLIDPRKNQARIRIHLDTGHRYYIGKITYGSLPYTQNFMDRVVTLRPGEVFSSGKIRQLQQDMENSYYFNQVNIEPQLNTSDDYNVPITIDSKADKPVLYKVGVGYGSTSGQRILGGLSLRHLNDSGAHFESQVSISQVLSGLTANYYVPGQNPLTDTWVYSANYNLFLPSHGKSHVVKFTGGYETKTPNTQLTINLNALIERFYVTQTTWQTSHLLFPQLNYNYLNTDNRLNPTRAININFNVSAGSQALASSTSYLQTDLKMKGLYAFSDFGRIILRGEVGMTAVHNLPVFPLSMRFFAGGMGSVRGFADSGIGPGKYLEVASVEYQQKLKGNLYAGVFYDVGRATDHFDTPYSRGVGLGLVYNTPIGPLKLYLAQAISKSDRPRSVEFSIGPEFS